MYKGGVAEMYKKKLTPAVLAENLKMYRKNARLTQEQVTQRLSEMGLDITRQSYNRYETNNASPDYGTLMMLADIYGTDLNTLLGYEPKQQGANDIADVENDKLYFDLITLPIKITGNMGIARNEKGTRYKFTLQEKEYIDSRGQYRNSPKGILRLDKRQFTELRMVTKSIWRKEYYKYYLQILRLAKDSKSVDEFIRELKRDNGIKED